LSTSIARPAALAVSTDLASIAPCARLNRNILHRLSRRIVHAIDLRLKVHQRVRDHGAVHSSSVCTERTRGGFCSQLTRAWELTYTIRDRDRQVENCIPIHAIQPVVLVDADIVVSPRSCALLVVSIPYQTLRPLKVYVLDRLSAFLIHNICEGRRGCRGVRDGEVLLHGIRREEEREVEDLRKRVDDTPRWDSELAIAGDIERNLEKVSALWREGLGLVFPSARSTPENGE
jgi:hypothetical protein